MTKDEFELTRSGTIYEIVFDTERPFFRGFGNVKNLAANRQVKTTRLNCGYEMTNPEYETTSS